MNVWKLKHWPENNLLPSKRSKCGLLVGVVLMADDFYDVNCAKCGRIISREMSQDIIAARTALLDHEVDPVLEQEKIDDEWWASERKIHNGGER